MKKLVRDVRKNGRAARRDASLGHKNEETREEFAKVHARRGCGEFGEEVRGEIGEVMGS